MIKEQRLAVNRLISAFNDSGAFYGVMTYKKGLQDCVALLQELNPLRASWKYIKFELQVIYAYVGEKRKYKAKYSDK